jgi:hypothetical protein
VEGGDEEEEGSACSDLCCTCRASFVFSRGSLHDVALELQMWIECHGAGMRVWRRPPDCAAR